MLTVGKGGGPHPFSNAFKPDNLNSLRYNTSEYSSPVHLVYGTQRISVNVIDGFGFTGNAGGAKGKSGGKGGGKSSKKGGNKNNFSVNVALALCQGPVAFDGAPNGFSGHINRVWSNGSVAGIDTVPLNRYTGADGQAIDPTFANNGEGIGINYSGTAYLTGTPMYLGQTPALPDIQVEVCGFGKGTAGPDFPGDANPEFIISDLISNSRYGAGFPAGNIDSATFADYANYCQAGLLAFSYSMDRSQPAARWVDDVLTLSVAGAVMTGPFLKIIPYFTATLSGNSAVWNPNLTVQYSVNNDDYLGDSSTNISGGGTNVTDPVIVSMKDPATLPNWVGIEFQDVTYAYNNNMQPSFDQAAIDQYGVIQEPNIFAIGVTNKDTAKQVGQLTLNRKQYVRRTYKFKLGWRFSLLEPMDIIGLTDSNLGLSNFPVRIIQIDEDQSGDLSFVAEELPNVASLPFYARQGQLGSAFYDLGAAPGNTNPPIIFEPPAQLTNATVELWIVATGASPNWGGCIVYVSGDNQTYSPVASIQRGARQGLLTAILPSHADPDTVDTLSVDLSMSDGTMVSGTRADADQFVTLCFVDGELVSYQTATLTSANHYNLTYLRRGIYGSTISMHNVGTKFARIGPNDPSVLKWAYPASMIGQTIYLKFLSYNLFGGAAQDLSEVQYYTYVLNGNGVIGTVFGSPGGGIGFPTNPNPPPPIPFGSYRRHKIFEDDELELGIPTKMNV